MRGANLLFCCLFVMFTFAGISTQLLAADLDTPRQAYPNDRSSSDNVPTGRQVAEFCQTQRQICRKICYLNSRFEDDFDGCPHSCDSRAGRCIRTGCYRWMDPDFLIAEKFGGLRCTL